MIKLTFPRTHSIDDLRPLFEQFREAHPGDFEDWYASWHYTLTHQRPKIDPTEEDPKMHRVMNQVDTFLKANTKWDSRDAVITGGGDFQKIMAELVQNDLQGEVK